MDGPFNHRQMFERYVYDYMIKKGLHEAAETFLGETETRINPQSPPEIDVPDGFLHEWWLINSDHISGWQRQISQDNEGSSFRDESEMWQHGVPTQSGDHELNEQSVSTQSAEQELTKQMIEELTLDESFGVILGGNLLPSQSGGKRKRSKDSEDENTAMPVVEEKKDEGNFSSKNEDEDSSSRDAYMDDSSCHDKDNDDDGVISAINSNEHHQAPKYDESQGVISEGSLAPETWLHPEGLMCSPHSNICRKNEGKRTKPGDSEDGSIYMPGVIIGGNLVSETMPNSGSSITSPPPANLACTDTQGIDSATQTNLRTIEIASQESGGKRNRLGDPEDGGIDVPEHDESSK